MLLPISVFVALLGATCVAALPRDYSHIRRDGRPSSLPSRSVSVFVSITTGRPSSALPTIASSPSSSIEVYESHTTLSSTRPLHQFSSYPHLSNGSHPTPLIGTGTYSMPSKTSVLIPTLTATARPGHDPTEFRYLRPGRNGTMYYSDPNEASKPPPSNCTHPSTNTNITRLFLGGWRRPGSKGECRSASTAKSASSYSLIPSHLSPPYASFGNSC